MACICSICKEHLTRRPDTLPPNANFVILGIQCGHVFHQPCIKKWFRVQFTQTDGLCPVCDKPATLQQALRLFLQEGEEATIPTSQPVAHSSSAAPLNFDYRPSQPSSSAGSSYNSRPTSGNYGAHSENYYDDNYNNVDYNQQDDPEMGHVTAILEETGTELEKVRAQHEELKFKYGCLASELDNFQKELRDTTFMDDVYRENWQINIDHVSKQKDDAFQKLENLESRIRRLETRETRAAAN